MESGQAVLVVGDRGIDAGIIEETNLPEPSNLTMKIIRPINNNEFLASFKRNQERSKEMLEFARKKCRDFNLQMNIEDAELQYDGHKIILYANVLSYRENFTNLISVIFNKYKNGSSFRIWIEVLNTRPGFFNQKREAIPDSYKQHKGDVVSNTASMSNEESLSVKKEDVKVDNLLPKAGDYYFLPPNLFDDETEVTGMSSTRHL